MKPVVVRQRVGASQARAFAVFTEQVDAWWRRGPRFRFAPDGQEGVLLFELVEGGRFLERFPNGDVHVVGNVLSVDAPRRLSFSLGPVPDGAPPPTWIEIVFEPLAPDRTEVVLTHHGLEHVPAALRRGALGSAALHNVLSVWWAELVAAWSRLV